MFALLVGCYDPPRQFQANADAGEDAIDAPPNGDPDGDGIPNAIDLCPSTKSTDNRDHDGDMKGDVCDPCPHLPSDLQGSPDIDTDLDGVGNGCDPRVEMAGEKKLLFNGFTQASDLVGWDKQPAVGWVLSADNNHVEINAIGIQTASLLTTMPLPWNVQITAAIEVVDLPNTTVEKFAGIAARVSSSNFHRCATLEVASQTSLQFRIFTGQTSDLAIDVMSSTIGPHVFRFFLDGTQGRCYVEGSFPMAHEVSRGVVQGGSGRIGVTAGQAQIKVDYIFVIEVP